MLLLSTDRSNLLRPLQTVIGVVERRNTLPILANVLIEGNQDGIQFIATDLEIQVSTRLPHPAETPFALTVSARKLYDICRSLPEEATIRVEWSDSHVRVFGNKSRFNLQTLPAADFPKMLQASQKVAGFRLSQKRFKGLLDRVQFAMAQQDIRYYLNGVLFERSENGLLGVATDGHRLAYSRTDVDGSESPAEVIVPRKTVVELGKLLGEGDGDVVVELGDKQARFGFSNVELTTKLVEGKFPDYRRVIPQGHPKLIRIGRLAFLQALQRVSILSSENRVRGVRLVLTPDTLRVVCTNAEQEEGQDELPVNYAGEPLDIGFNAAYLMDALAALSAEEVECSFGDATSSMLTTIPGDPDFKYVVMPMRI